MSKTKCIQHRPSTALVILHQDYLDICDNNKPAAIILKILEYWTDVKLENNKQTSIENKIRAKEGKEALPSDAWIYKTHQEFIDDSLDLLKLYEVKEGLKLLLDKGFISKRNNPAHHWDRTLQYQLNINRVQNALNNYSIGYRQPMEGEPVTNQSGTDNEAIPEITPETPTDINTQPPEEKNKPPLLDPLSYMLDRLPVPAKDEPYPKDPFFGYRDSFLKLYQEILGRSPSLAARNEIIELSHADDANPIIWEESLKVAVKTHPNRNPSEQRCIDIYKAGGDYKAFAAKEWPKEEAPSTPRAPSLTNIDLDRLKELQAESDRYNREKAEIMNNE